MMRNESKRKKKALNMTWQMLNMIEINYQIGCGQITENDKDKMQSKTKLSKAKQRKQRKQSKKSKQPIRQQANKQRN